MQAFYLCNRIKKIKITDKEKQSVMSVKLLYSSMPVWIDRWKNLCFRSRLTLCMLCKKKISTRQFEKCFLFFAENEPFRFHENCLNLHKMSKPVVWEKIRLISSICRLLNLSRVKKYFSNIRWWKLLLIHWASQILVGLNKGKWICTEAVGHKTWSGNGTLRYICLK